jgi:membrane fusion protein, multidrug efflux system
MMKQRAVVLATLGIVILGGLAYATRDLWMPHGAVAQAPSAPAGRVVPVEIAVSVRKMTPVQLEALGTVVPIEAVAVRTRVDSEIVGVHFRDGAIVKTGDPLFTLDSRALEAQIKQAEGNVARDQAQLDGAERDVRRYTELVAKNATPVINLDNAKTQADTFRANIKADQAALENLKVQLSYCTMRAPISGRISAAAVKVGNFVRAGDAAALATINQIAPIYVMFPLPQRSLADVRHALGAESALVEAMVPGETVPARGQLTMIDNSVDSSTGMVSMRATMDNADQLLWPGQLVTTKLTLRDVEAVVIPAQSVQTGQTGPYVFVVKDNIASVRPVTISRVNDSEAVVEKGLEGGETVVTMGQLLLANGIKVAPRAPKVGS